ncbi:MAG: hypothetical protein AAF720_02665 [Pseudomonadota bacterium]
MAKAERSRKDYLYASGSEALAFAYLEFEADLEAASAKDAAKIDALLKQEYCEFGRVRNSEKWNADEHRHKVGHAEYRVQAAKAYQCRVYGVEGSYNGSRAFFISAVEPKKKKDKADRKLLKTAAERAVELVAKIKGAKI